MRDACGMNRTSLRREFPNCSDTSATAESGCDEIRQGFRVLRQFLPTDGISRIFRALLADSQVACDDGQTVLPLQFLPNVRTMTETSLQPARLVERPDGAADAPVDRFSAEEL